MERLLKEIDKWSDKYEISFQFWGEDNNNVYISKDYVDLYDSGGYETAYDVIKAALEWIYRVNRTPKKNRIV